MKFKTIKEAKDFLVNKIAAEAEREKAPLSQVERNMLYFSGADSASSGLASVSEDFDENDYEQKIGKLIRQIEARNHADDHGEEEAWDEAVLRLSDGDHYLSVLIGAGRDAPTIRHGFIPTLSPPSVRPPNDRLKLWLTAFAVALGIFVVTGLYLWLFGAH